MSGGYSRVATDMAGAAKPPARTRLGDRWVARLPDNHVARAGGLVAEGSVKSSATEQARWEAKQPATLGDLSKLMRLIERQNDIIARLMRRIAVTTAIACGAAGLAIGTLIIALVL